MQIENMDIYEWYGKVSKYKRRGILYHKTKDKATRLAVWEIYKKNDYTELGEWQKRDIILKAIDKEVRNFVWEDYKANHISSANEIKLGAILEHSPDIQVRKDAWEKYKELHYGEISRDRKVYLFNFVKDDEVKLFIKQDLENQKQIRLNF